MSDINTPEGSHSSEKHPCSRRDMLKLMGATAAAGLLSWSQPFRPARSSSLPADQAGASEEMV
jgi:hypothetical protein